MPRTGPTQGHHRNFAPRKLTPPNGLTTRQPLPPNPPKSLYFRGIFVVAREQSENCKHTRQTCPLLSVTTIYFTMLDYKSFGKFYTIYFYYIWNQNFKFKPYTTSLNPTHISLCLDQTWF